MALSTLTSSFYLRHPLRVARFAALLAAIACALALARLIWLPIAGPTLPVSGTEIPPPSPTRAEEPLTPIAQWHLFGNALANLPPSAAAAPETALQLFLRGTVNADDPKGGIAIIADSSGNERGYRIGEQVAEGVRLEAVEAGRVLLSRNGHPESLTLPRETSPGAAALSKTGGVPAASKSSAPLPGTTQRLPFVSPMIAPGGPNLEQARAALSPDLAALAKDVSALPVMENGRVIGLRLAAGRDSDLLQRVGLRPNDVVTAVNGIPVDGPQRLPQVIETLRSKGSAQVSVRRNGEDIQLTVGTSF